MLPLAADILSQWKTLVLPSVLDGWNGQAEHATHTHTHTQQVSSALKREETWSEYITYMYENVIMKPVVMCNYHVNQNRNSTRKGKRCKGVLCTLWSFSCESKAEVRRVMGCGICTHTHTLSNLRILWKPHLCQAMHTVIIDPWYTFPATGDDQIQTGPIQAYS